MSLFARIDTLKLCTSNPQVICDAAKNLGLKVVQTGTCIEIRSELQFLKILNQGDTYYIEYLSSRRFIRDNFEKFDSECARIESNIRQIRLQQIEDERREAQERSEMFRVRQLKKEQETVEFEREKLELEKQNFVEAKKLAIEAKAKAMGYSVKETVEDGKIKLKLIKRVYRC